MHEIFMKTGCRIIFQYWKIQPDNIIIYNTPPQEYDKHMTYSKLNNYMRGVSFPYGQDIEN